MTRNGLALNRPKRTQDLFGFPREFDNFFGTFLTDTWPAVTKNFDTSTAFKPNIDVIDRPQEYLVHAELPGLEEKDIDLSIDGEFLVLRGEKKQEERSEKEGTLHLERSYGTFERRFTLPNEVDANKISAKFKNGVLEVTLPKSKEAKETVKKITIG